MIHRSTESRKAQPEAAKDRKSAASNTDEYRQDLYAWLVNLWQRVAQWDAVLLPADLAERCRATFPHENWQAPESVTVETLEGLRRELLAVVWDRRLDRSGKVDGWPWRTAPTTRVLARRYATTAATVQDVLGLSAVGGGAVAWREVLPCDSAGTTVHIVAGTSRAEVIAALLDLLHAVQTNWGGLLEESMRPQFIEDWDPEQAERTKWATK
jgi:hypothetical protein